VSATSTTIPPFIIFKGKQIQSTWIPSNVSLDWMTAVSPKGWTSNKLGYKWLIENFELQTREKARYQHLYQDSSSSLNSWQHQIRIYTSGIGAIQSQTRPPTASTVGSLENVTGDA
jgi:hypothetical protein